MYEFPRLVVNRDWFSFTAKKEGSKFIYKTSDKVEIEILEKNGFKDIKPKKSKNESNKKRD